MWNYSFAKRLRWSSMAWTFKIDGIALAINDKIVNDVRVSPVEEVEKLTLEGSSEKYLQVRS